MAWIFRIALISLSFVLLSACNGEDASSKEGDYDTTKKMVVDILQTEDGKKAIQELMTDEKMKEQLVIESDVVKDTINNVLVSEKGKDMWTKLFKDPSFVDSFAKSMTEEQEKLMKSLMNDADFQKQMLDLLKNPEITKQMLDLMKSQQFRSHLEDTIKQTLDTPLFQAKMTEILLQAAEKQDEAKKQDQDKEQDQGKSDSSNSGSGQ